MKNILKLVGFSALIAVYAAMGWVVGLVVLTIVTSLLVARFIRARRALQETIRCPWCRVDVPQYGAFACGNCRARTLGWVWRCSACAAWAGHVECPGCGMSVPNPLVGRP